MQVGIWDMPHVAVSPSGSVVCAVGDDRLIHFLRPNGDEYCRSECISTGLFTFSADGSEVLTADDSSHLYWIDASDGQIKDSINFHGMDLSRPTISPDGRKIVVICANLSRLDGLSLLTVIDARTHKILSRTKTVPIDIRSCNPSFSPGGEMFCLGGADRVVAYNTGSWDKVLDIRKKFVGLGQLLSWDVNVSTFFPNGTELLAGYESYLYLISIRGTVIKKIDSSKLESAQISKAWITPNSRSIHLVTIHGALYDVSDGGSILLVSPAVGGSEAVNTDSAAYSLSGKVLARGSEGGCVTIVQYK